MTKLYLRNTVAAYPPPMGTKSVVFSGVTQGPAFGDSNKQNLTLSETKGASTSVYLYPAPLSMGYYIRCSSLTLNAQSFGAGTWTFGFAVDGGSPSGISALRVSLYTWRKYDGRVSFIYDSLANLGQRWNVFTWGSSGQVTSFIGNQVTCDLGEVLVLEVYTYLEVSTAGYFYFDGYVEPTNGSQTSIAATYISTPTIISFSGAAPPLTAPPTVQVQSFFFGD